MWLSPIGHLEKRTPASLRGGRWLLTPSREVATLGPVFEDVMKTELRSMTGDLHFGTTHWTMIVNAGQGEDEMVSGRAMSKLCASYWPPVYAYIRRQGYGVEDAKDLTQGFFAQLIEKRGFRAADPRKGKFRSYLLGSLKFFLSNEHQRRQAKKRGGDVIHFSIDANEFEHFIASQLVDEVTPEILFERQWSRSLLVHVEGMLKEEYQRRGRQRLFDAMQPFLSGKQPDIGYADMARSLGETEGALKMTASRMRRRFAELLREHVAELNGTCEEVEDEIRYLLAAFVSSP